MSGLVHRASQVGADVVALQCHACGRRYTGTELHVILELGTDVDLQCAHPDCGAGGLIPHRESRIDERFPAEIATPYMPIPLALLDHRAALGVGAHELLVVVALESHRRTMGDIVWPSYERLVKLTGLSESSVKRATANLVKTGLIERDRPRSKKGRLSINRYCLDPLWERLADHAHRGSPATHGDAETTTGHPDPWTPAPNTPTTGHIDPWTTGHPDPPPQVTLTPEVDVVEADPLLEVDPVGPSVRLTPDTEAVEDDHTNPDHQEWF
jgi:Helix-turn-helix domain